MLRALGNGAWKHYDANLAEGTCLVNTRGSGKYPGPAQTKPIHSVGGDKVPVREMSRKVVGDFSSHWKGKAIRWIVFALGPRRTWSVMQKDGETGVCLKEI